MSGEWESQMREIKRPVLTVEFVRSILDYDPSTGLFRWKPRADRANKWNTRYAGQIAGTTNAVSGYVIIMIAKANYSAHVLAWLYMTGEWAPGGVDHRHGVRNDNRFGELRKATSSDNGCNKSLQKNNTTGVVGVIFNAQCRKFEARIYKGGRYVWRYFFKTLEEAAAARHKALPYIHGEFAISDPERPRYRHPRDH